MIESNNCCVCCGRIIPEGFQYCRQCYEDNEQMMAVKTMAEKKKET